MEKLLSAFWPNSGNTFWPAAMANALRSARLLALIFAAEAPKL